MKHFVEITSKMGSKHFPITLNSLNLYIFEDVYCDAVDAFAESLDIKHSELVNWLRHKEWTWILLKQMHQTIM